MKLCRFLPFLIFFSLIVSTNLTAENKKHTVEKGETFYSISKKYNLSVKELLELNGLSETAVLKAGDSLIVEKSVEVKQDLDTYIVAKGDTLYSIARNSNSSVAEIQKLNGFDNSTVLKIGQKIVVPGKGLSAASSETAVNGSAMNGAGPQSASSGISASTDSAVIAKTTEDPRSYDNKKKGDVTLVWPVQAKEVTYVTGKISGVSITASNKNESVTVIRSGTVMSCSTYRGFGQVVFVQAPSGHIYVYSGMDTVTVKQGQNVAFGDVIGTCGTDALSGKNSISLMVYQNGKVLDPAKAPRG